MTPGLIHHRILRRRISGSLPEQKISELGAEHGTQAFAMLHVILSFGLALVSLVYVGGCYYGLGVGRMLDYQEASWSTWLASYGHGVNGVC